MDEILISPNLNLSPSKTIDKINGIVDGKIFGYKVIRHLGTGSYGNVVKVNVWPKAAERGAGAAGANHDDASAYASAVVPRPKVYAIKIMDDEVDESTVENEVRILQMLKSLDPNNTKKICYLKEYFRDLESGFHYLVFPYYGVDLENFVRNLEGRFYIPDIRQIIEQLLSCLDFLQQHHIIHCDIKPSNIVFEKNEFRKVWDAEEDRYLTFPHNNPRIKLVDFGLALQWNSKENYIGKAIQSPRYRAPEAILDIGFDLAVDMWSVGCTIFALWINRDLFFSSSSARFHCGLIEKYFGRFPTWMRLAHDRRMTTLIYQKHDSIFDHDSGYVVLSTEDQEAIEMKRLNDDEFKETFVDYNYAPQDPETIGLWDLMEKMLQIEPKDRITPKDALVHPFITNTMLNTFPEPEPMPHLQYYGNGEGGTEAGNETSSGLGFDQSADYYGNVVGDDDDNDNEKDWGGFGDDSDAVKVEE